LEIDCWFRGTQRRCFNCEEPKHMRKECSKLRQFGRRNINSQNNKVEGNHGTNQRRNPPKPQVKAKFFALGWIKLGANPTIFVDTLAIHNCSVKVLVDLSSSHSYINEDCGCHLGWVSLDLSYTLLDSTLLGKSAEAGKYIYPDV
jgi:hypothetical protein